MEKIIKRIGSSLGIIFDMEDRKIYGFDIGDVVDVEVTLKRKASKSTMTKTRKKKTTHGNTSKLS